MAQALLEVAGLYAGYRDLDILQGVDLTVRNGQIVTIIGPNGAGKSTLAKVVCGLLKARRGDVRMNGVSLVGRKPSEIVKRGLAYVPQERNVFPNLTVWENLRLGGQLLAAGAEARTERQFAMFPALRDKRHQKAGVLSGGQRQMLAMARALMLDPTLLVLDEPSAGLAPKVREAVFEQIRAINATGCTILMVEQNARLALAMSDWGYVLDMGRNALDDRGAALLDNPRVIASYLGSLGTADGGASGRRS